MEERNYSWECEHGICEACDGGMCDCGCHDPGNAGDREPRSTPPQSLVTVFGG